MSPDKIDPELQETPPVVVTETEEKQVEERVALGANVVYETVRREGDEEMLRTSSALAWSGLAAGLSMGFSFVAEALLASYLPDRPWRPLISKLGYSVGFLIVVLGRQQLFTENTLTVILPLLLRSSARFQSGGDFSVRILHCQGADVRSARSKRLHANWKRINYGRIWNCLYPRSLCGLADRPDGVVAACR